MIRCTLCLLLLLLGSFLLGSCSQGDEEPGPQPLLVRAPRSESVRRGARLYHNYCAYCHGETGNGDGFNTPHLPKLPRDYTDSAYMQVKTDQDLYDAIAKGGKGVGLSALMPPYGRTLRPWEIRDIVAFIRTFARREGP